MSKLEERRKKTYVESNDWFTKPLFGEAMTRVEMRNIVVGLGNEAFTVEISIVSSRNDLE
jgi:hypothetical protein